MRSGRRASVTLLVLAMTAAALALAGCGSDGDIRPLTPAQLGGNDINPKPRELVRDGGELRWPIDGLPANFNYNEVDGNYSATSDIVGALLPTMFRNTADGGSALNVDYLDAAGITGVNPQVVTYTLTPQSRWSDGVPITWHDFEAQWQALRGDNPAYRVSGRTGYENIFSVTRGRDDKQAVVTFARSFAEWRSLFSPLYPAATNSDPRSFNTGWVKKLPFSGGPFKLDAIDETTNTVTLRRNERWWGAPPRLDRIVFRSYDRGALADALAGNEIDFYRIGSSEDLLRRAQAVPGVAIRQSPDRSYNCITFNGGPGSILSDLSLRRAIAQGIDRTAIAKRLIGPIVPDASQHGNHLYPYDSKDYRDNSDVLPYDTTAANRELDQLGWLRAGPDAPRAKDGRPLSLRLLETGPNPIGELIDKTVQEQLAQLGVSVIIEKVPMAEGPKRYKAGTFDLVGFVWVSTTTPFSASRGIYLTPKGEDVQQNYGQLASQEIGALFDQGIRELDDTKRAEIGNKIDRLLWAEVHHLPLYPSTGAYAVRSTLANFGAPGLADIDYVNTGYLK